MTVNQAPEATSPPECQGSACGQCGLAQRLPPATIRGVRLASASAACFLFPIVLAVCGAAACGTSPTTQLLGAAAGLLTGMFTWRLLARMLQVPEEAA